MRRRLLAGCDVEAFVYGNFAAEGAAELAAQVLLPSPKLPLSPPPLASVQPVSRNASIPFMRTDPLLLTSPSPHRPALIQPSAPRQVRAAVGPSRLPESEAPLAPDETVILLTLSLHHYRYTY